MMLGYRSKLMLTALAFAFAAIFFGAQTNTTQSSSTAYYVTISSAAKQSNSTFQPLYLCSVEDLHILRESYTRLVVTYLVWKEQAFDCIMALDQIASCNDDWLFSLFRDVKEQLDSFYMLLQTIKHCGFVLGHNVSLSRALSFELEFTEEVATFISLDGDRIIKFLKSMIRSSVRSLPSRIQSHECASDIILVCDVQGLLDSYTDLIIKLVLWMDYAAEYISKRSIFVMAGCRTWLYNEVVEAEKAYHAHFMEFNECLFHVRGHSEVQDNIVAFTKSVTDYIYARLKESHQWRNECVFAAWGIEEKRTTEEGDDDEPPLVLRVVSTIVLQMILAMHERELAE